MHLSVPARYLEKKIVWRDFLEVCIELKVFVEGMFSFLKKVLCVVVRTFLNFSCMWAKLLTNDGSRLHWKSKNGSTQYGTALNAPILHFNFPLPSMVTL